MWIYFAVLILSLPVLWVVALVMDAKFFNGRYLVKSKTTSKELREELINVLEHKEKPFLAWDESTFFWLYDYFLFVSILDNHLDEIRKPIVESLELHGQESRLHPDTIALIERAIEKLR